jgi:hypothetical protein
VEDVGEEPHPGSHQEWLIFPRIFNRKVNQLAARERELSRI